MKQERRGAAQIHTSTGQADPSFSLMKFFTSTEARHSPFAPSSASMDHCRGVYTLSLSKFERTCYCNRAKTSRPIEPYSVDTLRIEPSATVGDGPSE
jgi:hypothetical protein